MDTGSKSLGSDIIPPTLLFFLCFLVPLSSGSLPRLVTVKASTFKKTLSGKLNLRSVTTIDLWIQDKYPPALLLEATF